MSDEPDNNDVSSPSSTQGSLTRSPSQQQATLSQQQLQLQLQQQQQNTSFAASLDWQPNLVLPNTHSYIKHFNLCRFLSSQLGLSVLVQLLVSGGVFLKHGSHGSPHFRYISCSEDLSTILWSDTDRKKIHGKINTNTLINIQHGHQTKIMMERAPKGCVAAKCFSLISSARTLDLECGSVVEAQLWSIAFYFLIDYMQARHRSSSSPTPTLHSTSTPTASLLSSSLSSSASLDSQSIHALNSHNNSNVSPFRVPLLSSVSLLTALNLLLQQVHQFHNNSVNVNVNSSSSNNSVAAHTGASLSSLLSSARVRVEQCEGSIERSREENRRLLISSSRKCIKIQESIDSVRADNDKLRAELDRYERKLTEAGVNIDNIDNENEENNNNNNQRQQSQGQGQVGVDIRDKLRSSSDLH